MCFAFGSPHLGWRAPTVPTKTRLEFSIYRRFIPPPPPPHPLACMIDFQVKAYDQIQPGDPLEPGTLLGPLHNAAAVEKFEFAVAESQRQGGKVRTISKHRIPPPFFF